MPSTAPDFSRDALKRGYDDDTFPHAKTGLRLYRLMYRLFVTGVVLGIIGVLIQVAGSFLPSAEPVTVEGYTLDLAKYADGFKGFVAGIGSLVIVFAALTLFAMFIVVAVYMANTVMRWRSWERGCFLNDFRAESLRKSLLRALNVNKYYREAKDSLKKSRGNDGSGDPSRSAQTKVEAYKALKKVRVYVNTRQSLDFDDAILRYFQIIIAMPFSSDTVEETKRLIQNVGPSANRVNKLKFGDPVFSEDDRFAMFTDRMKVKDRYKRKPVKSSKNAGPEMYEYAFSMDCFVDRTDEIVAMKQKAQRWAEQTADTLDNLLFTQDVKGRRLRTTVGSTTATVVYDMSFTKDLSQFDTKQKTIDQTLKMTGTQISVDSGELMVTVPLPANRKLPIDTKTLFTSQFGKPEHMEKLTNA